MPAGSSKKTRLLRVVWGDTVVGDETLAQNISTLRRLLGDQRGPTGVHRNGTPVRLSVYRRRHAAARLTGQRSNRRAFDCRRPPFRSRPVEGVCIRRWAAVATLAVCRRQSAGWRGLAAFGPQGAAVEFTVSAPDRWAFSTSGNTLALSPDGRQLAFVASDDERIALALAPAAGFVRASSPCWHDRGVAPVLVTRQSGAGVFRRPTAQDDRRGDGRRSCDRDAPDQWACARRHLESRGRHLVRCARRRSVPGPVCGRDAPAN